MRKKIFGRQFKRDSNERKALFKGLLSSMVLNQRIKTTEEKAKSIKGQVDKLITTVKRGNHITSTRSLLSLYLTPLAMDRLISDVTPRFADRSGGYTRIIKLGKRLSDNAKMAFLEWVDEIQKTVVEEPEKEIRKESKKAVKKSTDKEKNTKKEEKKTSTKKETKTK